MMWLYHKKLLNFNIFINNNSLVLVFLFNMANTNLFNFLYFSFNKTSMTSCDASPKSSLFRVVVKQLIENSKVCFLFLLSPLTDGWLSKSSSSSTGGEDGNNLNNRQGFDIHVTNICNRVSKKIPCFSKSFTIHEHS